MKIINLVFASLLVFVISASITNAQTQFIKYKKYLVPVSTAPNVYYIDDVDDSRQSGVSADPNGVLELPIVVGWKNIGHYKLVGLGADGPDGVNFDTSFVQGLLTLMEETTTVVLTGTALRDSIIDKALSLGSYSNRLVIAIGGQREIVLEAIVHANSIGTPINDRIRVIGIQPCVAGVQVTNCLNPSVGPSIQSAVGQDNYYIIADSTTTAPTFRYFYLNNSFFPHVGNRDTWYQTHYHQSEIGRYFRDNVSNGSTFEGEVKDVNGQQLLRIADFTALAYLIWGDAIWSSEFETRMYLELQAALATLPK